MSPQDRKEVSDLANRHINGITLKIIIPVIGAIVIATWHLSALYTSEKSNLIEGIAKLHAIDSSDQDVYRWRQTVDRDMPILKLQVQTLSATVQKHDEIINYIEGKPQPKWHSFVANK
jgi:hypothetical protein